MGIVYVDKPDAPSLVKTYDPNNLGATCNLVATSGSIGFKVPPGWVLSLDPPDAIDTDSLLPNHFPEDGAAPEYNTADAPLWYIEAWRAYVEASGDLVALARHYPALLALLDHYANGTRYGIGVDPADGLLRAGEMDPADADYQGRYDGGVRDRDAAYHQGPAWAWLLPHYALALHRAGGDAAEALALLQPLADHLADAGLGTLSELFDAEPPHTPRGAPSQAWSVACTLQAWCLLERAKGKNHA